MVTVVVVEAWLFLTESFLTFLHTDEDGDATAVVLPVPVLLAGFVNPGVIVPALLSTQEAWHSTSAAIEGVTTMVHVLDNIIMA